jgi:hypothetical protein
LRYFYSYDNILEITTDSRLKTKNKKGAVDRHQSIASSYKPAESR